MPVNIQEVVDTGREILGSSCPMDKAYNMSNSINFVGQKTYQEKKLKCLDSIHTFISDRNLDASHFWKLTVDEVQLMIDVEGPLINAVQTKFSAEPDVEIDED